MSARHCVHCGKAFDPVPVNPDEEFCSEWCRKQHDREESTVVIEARDFTTGERRFMQVTVQDVVIGGSPALAVNGVPVLWYENWIRDIHVREYVQWQNRTGAYLAAIRGYAR